MWTRPHVKTFSTMDRGGKEKRPEKRRGQGNIREAGRGKGRRAHGRRDEQLQGGELRQ